MDAPPNENDDTVGDDTLVGTEAGPQNTPSQWKKHFAEDDPPIQVASPPRVLPLCTYDEDETQIQFCSNVTSQEAGWPTHQPKKHQMQLAEVELPLAPYDNDVGDGESSNESEDLWAGGDSTLDQQQQTSDDNVDAQFSNAEPKVNSIVVSPHEPVATTSTDNADVDTELEDNDADEAVASAAPRTVASPGDPEAFYDDLFQRTMPAPCTTSPRKRRRQATKQTALDQTKALQPSPLNANELQLTESMDQVAPPSSVTASIPTSSSITATTRRRKRVTRTTPPSSPLPSSSTEAFDSSKDDRASSDAALSPPQSRRRRSTKQQDSSPDDKPPSTSGRVRSATTKARNAKAKAQASCPAPPINTEAVAESGVSPNKADLVRIVLTGLDPAPLMPTIEAIQGAVFEEDVTRGTHLVAPSGELKRTVKMLCGISTCKHVVDEKWLYASAKQGRPAPEATYCLHDPAKQTQWSFDLKTTMYHRSDRDRLFHGRVFYIVAHKSIMPSPSDLTKIIECAGGEVLPAATRSVDDGVIVIASTEALAVKSIQKKLGQLMDAPKYTPELILSGILQQSLDLTRNHVASSEKPHTTSKRKR